MVEGIRICVQNVCEYAQRNSERISNKRDGEMWAIGRHVEGLGRPSFTVFLYIFCFMKQWRVFSVQKN